MSVAANELAGRRALITGGAGFIGSRLAQRLVELGVQVTVLDNLHPDYGNNLFNLAAIRDRIDFHSGDIRDPALVRTLVRGQDFVFSLAAQTSHMGSMEDPAADVNINVLGQLNILEACRTLNPSVRMAFASTRQIYGKPDYLPVDEAHPIRPPDINGVSKFAAEGYQLIYDGYYGVRGTILRLTNTYGPGMRIRDAKQTFIGVWLRRLIEGKPLQIFGDGLQLRDFNYVDDVVAAFLLVVLRPEAAGRTYNLGGTEALSLSETADLLVSLWPGARSEYVPFPADRKQIDIGSCYSSFSRIEAELGWQPTVDLRTGLQASLDYYRQHFTHYVP